MSKSDTLEVQFWPAYDHRDEPNDQRGCCSTRMVLIYRGKLAVITSLIFTDWMANPLKNLYSRNDVLPRKRWQVPGVDADAHPRYITVGTTSSHSKIKRKDSDYEQKKCEHLGGATCYGGASYTATDNIFQALVGEGTEAAIVEMKKIHDAWVKSDDES